MHPETVKNAIELEWMWAEGNKPNTKEGTMTPFLLRLRNPETGYEFNSCAWYLNRYRMPLHDEWEEGDGFPDGYEDDPDADDGEGYWTGWHDAPDQYETMWPFDRPDWIIGFIGGHADKKGTPVYATLEKKNQHQESDTQEAE